MFAFIKILMNRTKSIRYQDMPRKIIAMNNLAYPFQRVEGTSKSMRRRTQMIGFILFLTLLISQCASKNSRSVDSIETQSKSTHYEKGVAYYMKSTPKDYLRALKFFKKSISKSPRFPEAYAMISLTYSRIGQVFFLQKEKHTAYRYYQSALRYAFYSIKLKKNLSKGYVALALYARQMQKHDQAIRFSKKAIALNPREFEGYAILGDCYHPLFFDASSDFKKSLRYYQKSLSILPNFIQARFNLALLYFFNENYSKSLVQLNKVLQINPKIPSFHYYMSLSHKGLNHYPQALSSIQRAIGLHPDNAYYYSLKGQILYQMKEVSKAMRAYKKAISLNRNIAQFYYHIGLAYSHTKQKLLTIRLYRKAIELDPKYDLPHYALAVLLDQNNRYQLAIKEYDIFLDLTDFGSLYKKAEKRVKYLKKWLKDKTLKNKGMDSDQAGTKTPDSY